MPGKGRLNCLSTFQNDSLPQSHKAVEQGSIDLNENYFFSNVVTMSQLDDLFVQQNIDPTNTL